MITFKELNENINEYSIIRNIIKDVKYSQKLDYYEKCNWHNRLFENEKDMDFIEKHLDKIEDWDIFLTWNKNINIDFIEKYLDKITDWNYFLTHCKNINREFIERHKDKITIGIII
jgi:hypothetical protein